MIDPPPCVFNDPSARRAVILLVTGRVQGVGFRASTVAAAHRHGVYGSVRNQVDGSVRIHAEAEPERLEAFLSWVRAGPPLARVDRVELQSIECCGLARFECEYD
jgi:acylphosphatase